MATRVLYVVLDSLEMCSFMGSEAGTAVPQSRGSTRTTGSIVQHNEWDYMIALPPKAALSDTHSFFTY
jgi:hypothetical protein